MATAVPAPTRGYRPPPQSQSNASATRPSPPMPAPITRIALAAKQNQILALQALQAAASAAGASSSASSSAGGSPPPYSSSILARSADDASSVTSNKRGRKFQALRAPAISDKPKLDRDPAGVPHAPSSSASFAASVRRIPMITTSVPHWAPEGSHPLIDPNSGKRSEIYSLINDRYPGAPGTALAKAREAQQKAILAAKREAAKKLASKAELEHLGVKGLGKKRKSSSPYATVGNAAPTSAAGGNTFAASRAGAATAAAEQYASASMSRESSAHSRGRSSAKPGESSSNSNNNNNLTVPCSSSRSRRPTSRATSPAPLTAQSGSAGSASRRSGTRSGSAVPPEDDAKTVLASSNGNNSNNIGVGRSNRGNGTSTSRGSSPPEGSKSVHGLSSTAPFQSSPLAASAITMEPLLDTDDIEPPEQGIDGASKAESLPEPSTSAGRNGGMKRKASGLSQEVKADEEDTGKKTELTAVSEALASVAEESPSKRTRRSARDEQADEEQKEKETSPSSVSSSRRTSPRMTVRKLGAAA